MPRYFFDINDGERATIDAEGSELDSDEAARAEAIGVLPDLARDMLPDGDRHTFIASVRDEAGRAIFRATLTLAAEWLK